MSLQTSFESVRLFTQEEFAEWVSRQRSELEHFELLNGRIVMSPPAGWPHGSGSALLTGLLVERLRRSGAAEVFAGEQGFELPSGDTLAPDAAVVSRARWEAAPPPEPGTFLRVVPDAVFEILSASTASRDRGEKKAIYESNGVAEYWLVDLLGRRLTRFVLADGRYGLPAEAGEGETLQSTVFSALALSIDELLS
jgi:Uma2 family endonuclease